MQQEQNKYRAWLLTQPPEEILNHAYEYSSREDILIALENVSLRPAQLRALLESQAPLADIYKDYRDHDTNALDIMAMCIEDRADINLMESTKKNWPPVYYQTARYAREHEELPQYRASMKLNEECRDEIDDAISYNYNGLCLDDGAVQQVLAGYGAERTRYIVAAAIQVRDGDARISPQNRRWADLVTATTAALAFTMAMPAFAANDPLATINALSDFVFSAIKAIGAILLGFGIVQIGLALKGHDASQRAQGFMTFFGGVVIYFAKDILDMILK